MAEPENGVGGGGGGGKSHEPLFLRFAVPKDWRTKDTGAG